eukprot:1501878-Rhodomonas_salina.1
MCVSVHVCVCFECGAAEARPTPQRTRRFCLTRAGCTAARAGQERPAERGVQEVRVGGGVHEDDRVAGPARGVQRRGEDGGAQEHEHAPQASGPQASGRRPRDAEPRRVRDRGQVGGDRDKGRAGGCEDGAGERRWRRWR